MLRITPAVCPPKVRKPEIMTMALMSAVPPKPKKVSLANLVNTDDEVLLSLFVPVKAMTKSGAAKCARKALASVLARMRQENGFMADRGRVPNTGNAGTSGKNRP